MSSALEAALNCFWQRGYEATSVRDLAASMGLSAPSLYNAFGDKQALFARALERYLDCTTRDRLRRYERRCLPKRRSFSSLLRSSTTRSMIESAKVSPCSIPRSEVAPHQSELGAVIVEQFAEIEAFFKRCILAAQVDRTVPRNVHANDAARLLLGVLLGIRVLARSTPNRSLLEGVARPALALLDVPRHKRKKTP